MIILDTNVISALMRPRLHLQIVQWLDAQPRASIWTTSVNVLETRTGILLLPAGRRKAELDFAFDELLRNTFESRILPFDLAAAEMTAGIISRRVPVGRNIDTLDTQIAGIAMSRNATLATRNTRHFDDLDIPLVNPWSA